MDGFARFTISARVRSMEACSVTDRDSLMIIMHECDHIKFELAHSQTCAAILVAVWSPGWWVADSTPQAHGMLIHFLPPQQKHPGYCDISGWLAPRV